MIAYRLDVLSNGVFQGFIGKDNKIVQDEAEAIVFVDAKPDESKGCIEGYVTALHILGNVEAYNNFGLWEGK